MRSRTLAQRVLAQVQAVEDAHRVAALEQALDEHAADVAGAAGDQNAQPRNRCVGRKPVSARKDRRSRDFRETLISLAHSIHLSGGNLTQ